MFSRSTFALNTEVEDSTARKHSAMSFGSLWMHSCRQSSREKDEGQSARCQPNAALRKALSRNRHSDAEVSWIAWSLSRVLGRPDSEPDDHRMRAHEAKVSVAWQQQEVGRPTHAEAI